MRLIFKNKVQLNVIIPKDYSKGFQGINFWPQDIGLLFLYDKEQPLSFWMKDVLIPLDIAFISKDMKIINIEHMLPQDTTPVKSQGLALAAVEVIPGWFERNGICKNSSLTIQKY